jgi:uncharacterized membrane protein YqjE
VTAIHDPTKPAQADKSLGDLFSDLSDEFRDLVRTQVELARTEVRNEAASVKRAGAAFGATAVAGWMALVMLSFALAWGLAAAMPDGVAFLLVGLAYAVAALVLFQRARDEARHVHLVPRDTIESLEEDAQWARQRSS